MHILINQKNKRVCSHNTSGVSGVSWDKKSEKWRARISYNGDRINLGLYEVFNEAIKARKDGEKTYGYHENHGRQNHITRDNK